MTPARANEFESNAPEIADLGCDQDAALVPAQLPPGIKPLRYVFEKWRTGSQVKTIEVVAVECSDENATDLVEVACELEFLSGASNRKIIHKNMALLDSALCDATEFAEFEITKMLNTQPNTGTKHRKHKPEGAAGRPQEKEAQQCKNCRDTVKNNHHLAMRPAVLKQLVVDVLAISGKDRASADESAQNRKRGLEDR